MPDIGSTSPSALAALLLDFDGVIVESTDIKTRAFAELFQEHPEHVPAIIDYHLRHLGVSRYKKFAWIYQELLKKPVTDALLEALGARFSQIVFEKILQAPFVPGARETLAACASSSVPVFIISGTPHDELHSILEARGLLRYVTRAWGTPTEKREAIRQIRSEYGFHPEEMLFVGDGMSDYHAATAEGVPFLARDTGEAVADWTDLNVVSVPDLTCLARLKPNHPVTVRSPAPGAPPLSLTLKQAGLRVYGVAVRAPIT